MAFEHSSNLGSDTVKGDAAFKMMDDVKKRFECNGNSDSDFSNFLRYFQCDMQCDEGDV